MKCLSVTPNIHDDEIMHHRSYENYVQIMHIHTHTSYRRNLLVISVTYIKFYKKNPWTKKPKQDNFSLIVRKKKRAVKINNPTNKQAVR